MGKAGREREREREGEKEREREREKPHVLALQGPTRGKSIATGR